MLRGIRAVAPGRPISVIGRVIESYARRFGYGVVRDYTGHGVGPSFHTAPTILHYDEPRATTVMQPGMTFTIEPMLTLGGVEWDMWTDGWTVLTRDGSWVAQWEHTIVVTDDGAEILTLPSSAWSTAFAYERPLGRRESGASSAKAGFGAAVHRLCCQPTSSDLIREAGRHEHRTDLGRADAVGLTRWRDKWAATDGRAPAGCSTGLCLHAHGSRRGRSRAEMRGAAAPRIWSAPRRGVVGRAASGRRRVSDGCLRGDRGRTRASRFCGQSRSAAILHGLPDLRSAADADCHEAPRARGATAQARSS